MMLAGLPPRDFLYITDQSKLLVYQAITRKAEAIEAQRRQDFADRVVNGVGKLLGGS